MATAELVSATGSQRGVTKDETGIKVESFEQDFSNPKSYLLDRFGGPVGFAIAYDPRLTFTLSGEVAGSTGLIAADFQAAYSTDQTLDTGVYDFKTTSGTWSGGAYLDSASISQNREAWKSTSATFVMIPGLS